MGRTNPTYRDKVRRLREQWEQYRRAIRHQYQQRFDHLWEEAQLQLDGRERDGWLRHAGDDLDGHDVSQQKEIEGLCERVKVLEGS